ncbi:dihydroxyacetone kinase [Lachnoclostridium sp. An14]|uniref:DegV family protein n=1 Tax=Lachnoclostridium sp. An14 TaxID=1965562 RepID=UPI000B36D901|nr:DegV family protein [Lachnoclostridium sp. An14]OUQ13790.1 dihydroxyacetone kinase [Lachnoclostridium sp. An14]
MSYKIIGDSCTDLTEKQKQDPHFQIIPLTLQVGDTQVVDDETFDQKSFLELVKACPECPKTACPSPEAFKKAYECSAENIFVVTLSEHLSGTYGSAVLGKQLYEEEHGTDKNIFVVGSHSASPGQLNIALFLQELCEAGVPFDEIVERVMDYRLKMKTYFVLESLDTLRKNGRLTGLQAFFATALNIKPVMGADEGVIIKLDQARGVNKALSRMCDIALKEAGDTSGKRLVIAHCNNPQRAELVRRTMCERAQFRDVVITETAGVATVYANDGGIIIAL